MIGIFVEKSPRLTSSTAFLSQRKVSSLWTWNTFKIIEIRFIYWTNSNFIVLFQLLIILWNIIESSIIRNYKRTFSCINIGDCDFIHMTSMGFSIIMIFTLTFFACLGFNIEKGITLNTFRTSVKWCVFRAKYSRPIWCFVII